MGRAPRAMLAIAMAIALTATASGCGLSFFFPVVEESTPIPEEVDAALEPYYTQVLSWDQCGEFLCATATAPLDWEDPAAEEIELALIRQPAKQEKVGSLLVNPGGPGASGYDFVADSIDFAVTDAVQDRYDIVGFDPRGVGRSSAVTCFAPSEMDQLLYAVPRSSRGSTEWITGQNELTHTFGQACLAGTGALLANVDTVSAARDLDLLRAILGEAQLDYLGYSYGAYLGTVYAGTYPDKVGRMVLDGPDRPGARRRPGHARAGAGPRDGAPFVPRHVHPRRDLPVPGHGRRRHGDGARHPRRGREESDPVDRRSHGRRRHAAHRDRGAAVQRRDMAGARLGVQHHPCRPGRGRPERRGRILRPHARRRRTRATSSRRCAPSSASTTRPRTTCRR